LGFVIAVGITCVYTALHLIRPRGWLWALALFNFIIAYFAFFELPFIKNVDVFFGYQLLVISLLFLLPDLLLKADFAIDGAWRIPLRIYGWLFTAINIIIYMPAEEEPLINTAIILFIYAFFFAVYALKYQRAYIGYVSTFTLSVSVLYFLNHFNLDLWLPILTGLAVLYYLTGVLLSSNKSWSSTLRNSALALGTILSLIALFTFKETGGWYALIIGLLFAFEMYLSRNGWFELGLPILFNIGVFLILDDFNIEKSSYHFLAYSLVWLLSDVISYLAFKNPRPLKWFVRGIGAFITIVSYGILFFESDSQTAAFGFAIYTLLFLTISLLYRQPNILYTFTLTLPLFVTFLFRSFDITKWIHPVIFIAMIYYGAGFFLRLNKRATGWDSTLLFSGLGLGVIVSLASPILGGLDAAIPVALAATLWAVEAFARKNVWLGFPTNLLYLLAYFIILAELKVDEAQFFSVGAALLGLIQHYLLIRVESKTGAFITGMVSQFILLGTTYIQMLSTENLIYFFILFFQSIAVIIYGVIIRSRSLTFIPIGFVVLGVLTIVYSALKEMNTVAVIGCTGILLLIFGIVAVMLRERITKFGERLSEWKA
jgi:hypothetical protein